MLLNMEPSGSVAVFFAVFLLAASMTQVSTQLIDREQVQCFTASSTAIGSGCEGSDPSFMAGSIEECCVQSPMGQFYRLTSGDQSCQACIVFGWLDGTERSIEEQGDATALEVGFLKGALFQQFTRLDRRMQLRFNIVITPGTAREGANLDFTVPTRSVTIGPDATERGSILTFIRIDRIALETRENFTLSLISRNTAANAVLSAADPNTFVIPAIQVIIEDVEDARLQFTESDYSSTETEMTISPSVQLLTNIATDLTVVAVAVNYTFLNDSRSPLLDVIPDVADYNPRRPINATSFPIEDQDFNVTLVEISFPAGNAQVRRINIGIVDDDINEVEQVFVIFLQVVDAVDPDRVDLQSGRNATLGIILDDDFLTIGFEQNSYTIFEAFNATGALVSIPVVKGNNQRSELTFELTFSIIRGGGLNSANIDQTDRDVDIIADLTQHRDFLPDKQSLAFVFELVNDNEPEADEVFQIELSLGPEESGLSVNLGGVLADGTDLFPRTEVVIVDNDAFVIIGWEQTFTSVNESHGILNLCVRVLNITGDIFPPGITIFLAANTTSGTATDPGDYNRLSLGVFSTGITATNSRACIEVTINDDDLLEETEVFTVQVVPEPSAHPSGLPENFLLIPNLTAVEIVDNERIILVNDTVIGDPLFTVPVFVPDLESLGMELDRIFLCYELHGRSDEWFNLVTDECTSVNAHYISTATGGLNVINQIAIRAADVAGSCREILVRREGCAVELDGIPLNVSARINENNITIRHFSRRVRVAVPNCQEQSLVMWIICETRTVQNSVFDDPIVFDSIRFDVMRGLNFRHRDSHGIIGQFWSVPLQLTRFNGVMRAGEEEIPDSYTVNVTRAGSPTRVFTGWFRPFSWGRLSGPCLYAGNQQAGVMFEVLDPNDPVIEGNYLSYRVPSAFEETDYQFGRFEDSTCR